MDPMAALELQAYECGPGVVDLGNSYVGDLATDAHLQTSAWLTSY